MTIRSFEQLKNVQFLYILLQFSCGGSSQFLIPPIMLPTGPDVWVTNYFNSTIQFISSFMFPLFLCVSIFFHSGVNCSVCVAEKCIEIVKFFGNNHTIVPFSDNKIPSLSLTLNRTGMFNSGLDLFIVKSKNVKVSCLVNRCLSKGQNVIRIRRIFSLKRIWKKNGWL